MLAPDRSIPYRGRIAPSPTGYLHLGHARTFWRAFERARINNGILILRNEDLDKSRVRPEFVTGFLEDLRWLGIEWQEGPDIGGTFQPYVQSERMEHYRAALQELQRVGAIYPCTCSRQDVLRSVGAPHQSEEEPVYPGTCRNRKSVPAGTRFSWRFRVQDEEVITFRDGYFGEQSFKAGCDFGDFVVWRHDDVPAYQLAVVTDDAAMAVTEVVRGADLLVSTARQLLLFGALRLPCPAYYHCPLMLDEQGHRLAKRNAALSIRTLRAQGLSPEAVRERFRTF